jgi:hypothetical protein
LKVFKVGTTVVADGDFVDVPYGTKSVVLTTTATDATSVITVRGNANFVTGENDVIVKVTATDGSFAEYTVTIVVADPSDDNSLDVLTLNGNDVADGDEITLPKGVTSVTIVATPFESHARAVVSGNTGLRAGANNVVIRVTAENGDVATNTIVVIVATNNDEWLLVDAAPVAPFGTVAATLNSESTAAVLASTTSSARFNRSRRVAAVTGSSAVKLARCASSTPRMFAASRASHSAVLATVATAHLPCLFGRSLGGLSAAAKPPILKGNCAVLTDWRGAALCGIVAAIKTPWGNDE